MNSSIIIQAVRQDGTKIRISSLLFVLCNNQHIVLCRNTDVLSCQVLSNAVVIGQSHQIMPANSIEGNMGQRHCWHKGTKLWWCQWSSGYSMTNHYNSAKPSVVFVLRLQRSLLACKSGHHGVTRSWAVWKHQVTPHCYSRHSACLRVMLTISGNKYFNELFFHKIQSLYIHIVK